MPVTAIVGANWGDEGKGKITDFLAAEADIVVRFQGGNNAGHTIINNFGKTILHLLPAGVFYPHTVNVIGPGVALNIQALLKELEGLQERNIPAPVVRISDRAQVILPFHLLLDEYEEERLADRKFGSTKKGMAPFYSDKYAKLGVQVADLYDEPRLRVRLEQSLSIKNVLFEHLYKKPKINADELIPELLEQGRKIKSMVADTTTLMYEALAAGKNILAEGQLGALRDPDHGIYPFPTSSSPLAGFASVGAGVPPHAITRVVTVVKAYSSCVGTGPFAVELFGAEGEELRKRGGDAGEYGATTGRPRRVGWLDGVATRYGCRVQGATEVVLTVLDALGYLDELKICTAYDIDGKKTIDFPNPALLDRSKAVFETLPGWKCDVSAARTFDELPPAARQYVLRIEEFIGVPIKWISVGPKRESMIRR
jgi:adenylosuccinate synthase